MKRSTSWIAVLPSLVIPVCFGMMMYMGLVFMIQQGILSNEMLLRYITGHPVSKVTVAMFFVGLCSLVLIAKNIFEQFGAESKISLQAPATDESEITDSETRSISTTNESGQIGESANQFEQTLSELPNWMHEHYLWQRLDNVLGYLKQSNSTTGADEELKYLADIDLDRQQQRYSLVQILIWATPMLGFLGTVLGISQALGGINVGPDSNFQQMMDGLRGSLYVAFDTTALALTLSMILMFGQFLIERFESQLLELVDQRARREISGHFDMSIPESSDTVDRIAEQVWDASRDLVMKQTEVWRQSMHAAERAWAASLTDVSSQVQNSLSDSLEENVAGLAHYLGESIEKADMAMSHRWEQWQVTLSDNARLMADHQQRVTEQTRVILRLAEQAENNKSFQAAIDENRAAIQATGELRETLDALSSAIDGMKEAGPAASNVDLASASASVDIETSMEQPAVKTEQETIAESVSGPASFRFSDYQPKSKLTRFAKKRTVDLDKRSNAEVVLPFRPIIMRTLPATPDDTAEPRQITRRDSVVRRPNKAA